MLFVTNEVLVDPDDSDLIHELIRQYGASIVPISPLPMRPHGLIRTEGMDVSAMPLPVRLQFGEILRFEGAAARIEELAIRGQELRGEVTVTSEYAARLAALVTDYAAAGRHIGLNVVGRPEQLPLSSAQEWSGLAGGNPFAWVAFSGKSRIVQAWQLVESYRQMCGIQGRSVWIGILDSGFWLAGTGRSFVPADQPESDFGLRPLQLNLLDESAPAGGASGIKCGDGYNCPWQRRCQRCGRHRW